MDSTCCEVRMRDNAVETLLSLLTSPDRAQAIAGDLAEEREQRGWIWFWLHVAGVTLTLWRNAAMEAPLRVLALTAAGAALVIAPAFGGAVAGNVFPQMIAARALLWWAGAVFTAAVLVAVARRLGFAVSATLAVVGIAVVLACLIVVPALASAQPIEWKDPSPHKTTLVTVEEGVQLEVLDWGGSGPALVLLAGGGASAHQYDDFAPLLTARYRVVGLTRRGHRGSSPAPGGYGFARMAEDVLRVMDAVAVSNPVVIGHSFAGEEMHVLGARHSAKIRGLVYVDAAFDRGDDADTDAYNAAARPVPAAPGLKDADKASFAALRAYLEKYGGAGPEAFLRTRYRANPDGTIAGIWAPDLPIRQAMMKEMQAAYNPYKPERIRVPALAIYACPKSADDLIRRGSSDRAAFPELAARAADDPALREQVEKLYELTRARVRKHEQWFEAFAERGRVVELSGTHNLIISNPREVLEQIEAFVSSLPKNP
jgi:pimeloyl-ACP methyl ester carboxylesterase